MKQFIKENWLTIIALILVLAFFSYTFYGNWQEKQTKCWLWVLDKDGEGLGARMDWSCQGFKATCESGNHNVPCTWINITGTLTDSAGCKCEVWK